MRNFTRQWKNGKWKYSLDSRNYDERPRARAVRIRPNCEECAKQGLKGLAHNYAWCNGLCKMHAGQKGLKNLKKRPNCKECVKQGLHGLAHNDAWCKGFCKMHARQKGLKDTKRKKKTHKTHMSKENVKIADTEPVVKNEQTPLKKRKMLKLNAQVHSATELWPDDGADEGADVKDQIHVIILASTRHLDILVFRNDLSR